MDVRVLNAIRRNLKQAKHSGNTERAERIQARLDALDAEARAVEAPPEKPKHKRTRVKKVDTQEPEVPRSKFDFPGVSVTSRNLSEDAELPLPIEGTDDVETNDQESA
jgi:hypothetical protein